MSQSRAHSLLEAWANAALGYFINLLGQLLIFPFYGAIFTLAENIQIGLFFLFPPTSLKDNPHDLP